MKNIKSILLIVLLVLAGGVVFYLLFTSEPAKNNQNGEKAQVTSEKSQAELEQEYKNNLKPIVAEYSKATENNNYSLDQATQTKNKLLELKGVPKKYQDLHINLVLALTAMEDAFAKSDEEGKIKSQQLVNQLKSDNAWLAE